MRLIYMTIKNVLWLLTFIMNDTVYRRSAVGL